ncbi:hypothetical protein CDL12_11266 [Handroanthus impetiginosus]|uniref:Uncharacterized protein n=1 Tax=Handroanthus impetiginosus TaxID=429701 RepID=A0A2G9HF67_9LAMI|nr:hypothetical protein CDL12_11266 [Handroanthus impetiginosus]
MHGIVIKQLKNSPFSRTPYWAAGVEAFPAKQGCLPRVHREKEPLASCLSANLSYIIQISLLLYPPHLEGKET